jgi:hypothetical protein
LIMMYLNSGQLLTIFKVHEPRAYRPPKGYRVYRSL